MLKRYYEELVNNNCNDKNELLKLKNKFIAAYKEKKLNWIEFIDLYKMIGVYVYLLEG
jgi:hypothetical protein